MWMWPSRRSNWRIKLTAITRSKSTLARLRRRNRSGRSPSCDRQRGVDCRSNHGAAGPAHIVEPDFQGSEFPGPARRRDYSHRHGQRSSARSGKDSARGFGQGSRHQTARRFEAGIELKGDDINVRATKNALLPVLTLSGEYATAGLAEITRSPRPHAPPYHLPRYARRL